MPIKIYKDEFLQEMNYLLQFITRARKNFIACFFLISLSTVSAQQTDVDGDGVYDSSDACPNEAGTLENNGCPEAVVPTQEVVNQLKSYARTILFDTGKSSFKQESFAVLQAITAIMNEYPQANFIIEGHTDNVGSKTINKKLSDSRANAVSEYLVENGIAFQRLTAYGFGEDKPISSNDTRAGRARNSRIEINLLTLDSNGSGIKTRYWCCTSHQDPKHCAIKKEELIKNHNSDEKYKRTN